MADPTQYILKSLLSVIVAWQRLFHTGKAALSASQQSSTPSSIETILNKEAFTARASLRFCVAGTLAYNEGDPWTVYPSAEACVNIPWAPILLVSIVVLSVMLPFLVWFMIVNVRLINKLIWKITCFCAGLVKIAFDRLVGRFWVAGPRRRENAPQIRIQPVVD